MSLKDETMAAWLDGFWALTVGLVCSIGLGIFLNDYGFIPVPEESPRSDLDYLGWILILYQVALVLCRSCVKGVEEVYGQLWGCNIAIALAATGILLHRPALVGSALVGVMLDQLFWYVDCLSKIVTGKFIIGVAKYLEWPETPFIQKVFSWHHLWFMPLCIYYLRVTGPGMPTGAFSMAMSGICSMAVVSRMVTPRDLNINMAFMFWKDVKVKPLHVLDNAPVWQYVPFLMLVVAALDMPLYPLVVYLCGGSNRVIH